MPKEGLFAGPIFLAGIIEADEEGGEDGIDQSGDDAVVAALSGRRRSLIVHMRSLLRVMLNHLR